MSRPPPLSHSADTLPLGPAHPMTVVSDLTVCLTSVCQSSLILLTHVWSLTRGQRSLLPSTERGSTKSVMNVRLTTYNKSWIADVCIHTFFCFLEGSYSLATLVTRQQCLSVIAVCLPTEYHRKPDEKCFLLSLSRNADLLSNTCSVRILHLYTLVLCRTIGHACTYISHVKVLLQLKILPPLAAALWLQCVQCVVCRQNEGPLTAR